MATGPEHYLEAEKLIGQSEIFRIDGKGDWRDDPTSHQVADALIARAQVHATLATAPADLSNGPGAGDKEHHQVTIERNRLRSALDDIAELVGGSVDHPESVRAAVEELDSALNDVRVEVAQLRVDMLAVQQHLQRAHGCDDAELAIELDQDFMRAMVDGLRGQRDEWRREADSRAPAATIERVLLERNQLKERRATVLDIVGCPDDASDADLFRVLRALIEEQPKFKPGQRVRVGRHLGTVYTSHPTMHVRLDGCEIAEFQTRFVHHVDEPRTWNRGDEEPPVGTTVRGANPDHPTVVTATRRDDGLWHVNSAYGLTHDANDCGDVSALRTWDELNADARLWPLVEVVDRDA